MFPLDNRAFTRFVTPRPSATAGRSTFNYRGEISGIPNGNAPPLLNRSFTISAEITVPDGGAEGMLVTQGGEASGYGLYVVNSKPVFAYNLLGLQRYRWEGPALPPGRHKVVFDFAYEGPGMGKGGTGVLRVDGKEVSTRDIPNTIPFTLPFDETFDVGVDTRSGVAGDYTLPFRFNGKIEALTIDIAKQQAFVE